MVHVARPNCQNLDNWGRCRVHTVSRWIRWLLPKGRPPCVFLTVHEQQDGRLACAEQLEYPRPSTPAPMQRKK